MSSSILRKGMVAGGVLCLDFVNTVFTELNCYPTEGFSSYEDLLSWGKQADLLRPDEAEALSGGAATDPEEAQTTLKRALALREAIHRVLSDAIAGEPQDQGALLRLNQELSEALPRLRVVPTEGEGYVWDWDRGEEDGGLPLDCLLWPVMRSAAELLTSPELGRVKVCAATDCEWMFLDESRNANRRWCESRACGNRERVRRHYYRERGIEW